MHISRGKRIHQVGLAYYRLGLSLEIAGSLLQSFSVACPLLHSVRRMGHIHLRFPLGKELSTQVLQKLHLGTQPRGVSVAGHPHGESLPVNRTFLTACLCCLQSMFARSDPSIIIIYLCDSDF